MATSLLSIGPVYTLTQNEVYALPANGCKLFAEGAPTLQQSGTVGFAANVAVTLTGGQADLAGGFLRSTAGTAVVRLAKI